MFRSNALGRREELERKSDWGRTALGIGGGKKDREQKSPNHRLRRGERGQPPASISLNHGYCQGDIPDTEADPKPT